MKIYTKTGDRGSSGLMGGKRESKADLRFHAIGTVDELNACLGITLTEQSLPAELKKEIMEIQHLLFRVGADLATPIGGKVTIERIDAGSVKNLEEWIDAMEADLLPLKQFILPGGSPAGALLHQARTVCRRAERFIVALGEKEQLTTAMLPTINRLGDYLFVAARYANRKNEAEEIEAKTKSSK
ncbi:MAG: cob(I)yrinic acid a,c-diamide adenosyltransferase [Candidatus Peribacteraceae bacterium]|nr:cob(I)yrinic acid a,c-diamide adenosyltransferase [Candidatus Peribacteraceae bacterium]